MASEVVIARHDERIKSLEERQGDFDERLKAIEGKLDKIYFWLVGVAGGIAVAILLLLVNVLVLRP